MRPIEAESAKNASKNGLRRELRSGDPEKGRQGSAYKGRSHSASNEGSRSKVARAVDFCELKNRSRPLSFVGKEGKNPKIGDFNFSTGPKNLKLGSVVEVGHPRRADTVAKDYGPLFSENHKKTVSRVFLMGESEKPRFFTFKPIGFCEFFTDLGELSLKR